MKRPSFFLIFLLLAFVVAPAQAMMMGFRIGTASSEIAGDGPTPAEQEWKTYWWATGQLENQSVVPIWCQFDGAPAVVGQGIRLAPSGEEEGVVDLTKVQVSGRISCIADGADRAVLVLHYTPEQP